MAYSTTYSKGEVMRKLDMTTGVDSALPIQFVRKLKEMEFDPMDIVQHFVMDYRDGRHGDFTPLTVYGLGLLDEIEKALDWNDMPRPEKVFNLATGEVVAYEEN